MSGTRDSSNATDFTNMEINCWALLLSVVFMYAEHLCLDEFGKFIVSNPDGMFFISMVSMQGSYKFNHSKDLIGDN